MGITSLFKLLYLLFGRCGLFTAFSLYDFTQLAAVGSDQILFQRAGFELHHNIVVIGRNQTVTSFKVSDLHCFSIGQVQGFLYPLGFVVLQIQNDLGLGVVDDALTKSAAVKVNERETSITLRLPGGLASDAESTCQNLLTGLMVYLAQLHDEYPDNIEVMEA